MGRQTLAAITAELVTVRDDDAPEIEVGQSLAGRETLAAIAAELLPPTRPRRRTLGFDEARPLADGVRPTTVETLEATTPPGPSPTGSTRSGEVAARGRTGAPPAAAGVVPSGGEAFEIHEMVTFVVRGDLSRLASERVRRDFVREHLAHRLPVASLDAVDRIDVTPWTVKGTVVVRVWCRVSPPR